MTGLIWFSASGDAPIKPKVYNTGFDFFGEQWEDLHLYTAKMSYSSGSFRSGYRHKDNLDGFGSVLIFDIDDYYTGQALHKATQGFKKLIVTTRSHTADHPKMRLIVPLDEMIPLMEKDLWLQVMTVGATAIGLDVDKLDRKCLGDVVRQYAPNPDQKVFYREGETLKTKEIIAIAENALEANKPVPKPIRPVFNNNSSMMPLQDMRQYIKDNHSFELMAGTLERYGLTVKRDGSVIIAGNKTQALSVDTKTGILADFAKDTFYDVVSLHVDHYQDMTLPDATKHFYQLLGGR